MNLGQSKNAATVKDSLGRGSLLTSNIYDMNIEMAYFDESPAGQGIVVLKLKDEESNGFVSQSFYVTGEVDGEQVTYVVDSNGNEKNRVAFNTVLDLCKICCDATLEEVFDAGEEHSIEVYDFDAGEVVDKDKFILVGLVDQKVKVGVLHVNKSRLDGDFEPTGEEYEANIVDKFFFPDTGMTVNEVNAEMDEPDLFDKWMDKYSGELVDRTKKPSNKKNKKSSAKPSSRGGSGAKKGGQKRSFGRK